MRRYWSILKTQSHPLRFLASRMLMKLGLSRFLLIRRDGYVLRFHPSALSASLWVNGEERHGDEHFFRRYLRPGETVVDIGANIGALTLLASHLVGPAGRVHAIEAHPRTFAFLETNLSLNQATNVRAHHAALGAEQGSVCFSDSRSDDQNAVVEGGGVEVPLRRLDDLNVDGRIHLLKIDVEGYEKFVLEGAPETLSRVECVYFECWERHFEKFGYSCGDVHALLRRGGFTVGRFEGDAWTPVPDDHVSRECENLLAVREPAQLKARGL